MTESRQLIELPIDNACLEVNVLDLYWLPECSDWKASLSNVPPGDELWPWLGQLANQRLDFIKTNQLDKLLQRCYPQVCPAELAAKSIRLAILTSSTATHLLPGIRVAALRRGMYLEAYFTSYGQYHQELLDAGSPLHRFAPNVVLFALDTRHVIDQMEEDSRATAVESATSRLAQLWEMARSSFGCQVVQQTFLPLYPALLGNNEHRLESSRRWRVSALNHNLRRCADAAGVDLLALDASVEQHGLDAWYDDPLWLRAKQEIHPVAVPLYGDLLVRLIAAQRGRSSKCLVLDLDNTLWGGVVGDDGLDGIVLGQGSALGEAYVSFQRWVRDQGRRGVVLAVCSKNDEANALEPFERHPEMVLSRADIAAFVANWEDKASNIRSIASLLNIGTDSLVFVDDNPFERDLVRRELPMVSVPELPEDPAFYARCIADAGYFESVGITAEDLERTRQYQANLQREVLHAGATDLNSYLASLRMELGVSTFDTLNLKRIVQLLNKTNQFNLTTRRYTEGEVSDLIGKSAALALHFRLDDRFGQNGIISVIIARLDKNDAQRMTIETWLMSCRVLGRQVESSCMNVLAAKAKSLGVTELIGEYIPTAKNTMVREHYSRLGFLSVREEANGHSLWRLPLDGYVPFETSITVREG